MPYRAMNVVVGIIGALLLAGLLLLGADVIRASRSGPGWRRKILGTGLVLLASLGLVSCEKQPASPPAASTTPATPPSAGTPLEATPEWKTIQTAWDFVTPLAKSGQSTTAQRKESDEKLKAAETAVGKLAQLGFISSSEAGLLNTEAAKLHEDLYRNPPVPAAGEMRISCYEAVAVRPADKTMQRLSQRLLLLEALTKEERLDEPVLAKVLPTMEADLNTLSDEKELAGMSRLQRREAGEVRDRLAKALADLKQHMEKSK